MSTSELPTPITNIADNADTSVGEAAISTSGADHNTHADSEVARQSLTTCEAHRQDAADQSTDAEHGVEHADTRFTEVEQLERDRHPEHDRCAGNDGLSRVQAGDQPEVRIPGDRREAGGHVRPHAALARHRRHRRRRPLPSSRRSALGRR